MNEKENIEYYECTKCGATIKESDSMCPECGTNLDIFECSECGTDLQADAAVCPNCGADVSEIELESDKCQDTVVKHKLKSGHLILTGEKRKKYVAFITCTGLIILMLFFTSYYSSSKSELIPIFGLIFWFLITIAGCITFFIFFPHVDNLKRKENFIALTNQLYHYDHEIREDTILALSELIQEKNQTFEIDNTKDVTYNLVTTMKNPVYYNSDSVLYDNKFKKLDVQRSAAYLLSKVKGWNPQNDKDKALYYFYKRDYVKLLNMGDNAIDLIISFLHEYGYNSAEEKRKLLEILENIDNPHTVQIILSALNTNVSIIAEEILKRMGKKIIDPLTELLGNEEKGKRILAVQVLGNMSLAEANKALVQALKKEKDASILNKIAKILIKSGHPISDKYLPEKPQKLTKQKEKEIEEQINRLGHEDYPDIVDSALKKLLQMGPVIEKPLLNHLKKNYSYSMAIYKIPELLIKLGTKNALEPLQNLSKHKDETVRKLANEAFSKLARKYKLEQLL